MVLLTKVGPSRRSRGTIFRAALLVFIIYICYTGFRPTPDGFAFLQSPRQWSESHATPVDVAKDPSQPQVQVPAQAHAAHEVPRAEVSAGESLLDNAIEQRQQQQRQPQQAVPLRQKPQQQILRPPTPPKETTPKAIETGLQRVIALLPDEMHTHDLLRPIEATGENRVRQLGLRTRSFRTLFDAWETLHLIPSEDGMYQRDDILQYVQNHPEIADNLQMSVARIIHLYEAYRSVLTQLTALLFPWISPYVADPMMLHGSFYTGQRGLVFSAGDGQAPYMLTSIRAIREMGCDLPIEVMYVGDSDLGEDYREQVEAIPGVITRDLGQMVLENGWKLSGWAAKPFAILHSSFREALFIDADALFLRDPAVLFDDPAYIEEGALFFKDRMIMPGSKKKWMQQILPKPVSKNARESRMWTGDSSHMQESGVVVVDKWRHFAALMLVARLNGPDRDGDKNNGKVGMYDMVYGDKETFWLGWELAGDTGYAFHNGSAAIIGASKNPKDDKDENADKDAKESDPEPETAGFSICGPQLLHLDRDDRPLWFNGWLLSNKFTGKGNSEVVDFKEFIKEPAGPEDPGQWKLHKANSCCLKSNVTYLLLDGEKDTLKMTVDMARDVGAI